MEVRKGFKQTDFGVIPNDWEVKEINFEIDLLTGFPFPSNKYATSGVRLLRGSNIKRGVTDWNEEITQYWEVITPDLKPYILQEEDIVIAMDGSLVGKSFAKLTKSDLPAILLQRVARIRSSRIDVGYLKEFICSSYFTKHCDSVKTSSAIPHISPSDIRQFKIPIPPTKKEQIAIATALSDADALISSLEKLIEKKRNIKQGVMQTLLTGKTRLDGFSEQWDECDIASLCTSFTKQTGFDYSAYIKPSLVTKYEKGTIPFIQNKDFDGLFINFDTDYFIPEQVADNFPRIVLNEKCLLISISGSIGRVALFSNSQKAFIGGAVAVAKFKDLSQLEWVMFYLQSNTGQNKLLINVKSGSHQNLILDDIRKIRIPMPTFKERNIIVAALTDIENEILSLEKKLHKSKLLKQGMMQELLTGKIRLV